MTEDIDLGNGAHQDEHGQDLEPSVSRPDSSGDGAVSGPPPKKRRRAAKPNGEKKYECKNEGCGKTYSRAEHLYRHQLNHTPKYIFRCDFPDCNRQFVRQDLCIRHRERHTTHGSQLFKKDIPITAATSQGSVATAPAEQHSSLEELKQECHQSNVQEHGDQLCPSALGRSSPSNARLSGSTESTSSTSLDPRFAPPTPHLPYSDQSPNIHRSNSFNSTPFSPEHNQFQHPSNARTHSDSLESGNGFKDALPSTNGYPQGHSFPRRGYSFSSSSNHGAQQYMQQSPGSNGAFTTSNGHSVPPNSRSSTYPMTTFSTSQPSQGTNTFAAALSNGLNSYDHGSAGAYMTMPDGSLSVEMPGTYAVPLFGGDAYNRSPNAMGDDFTAWLFSDNQNAMLSYNMSALPALGDDGSPLNFQNPFYPIDLSSSLAYSNPLSQHPMSVMSILDASSRMQYTMSDNKRQELLELMQNTFIERPHDAVKKRKDAVFEGDINADDHILSLPMMHTYIGSYWYHQHAQLPILHKPTFSADRTPSLLLLMVIAIGAATMDKAYGTSLTDSAAEFANFVVWHVRWEILRDKDFRPPAKLWIFQALLLIEVYEKMYATRALHERGHIHHDSTLTLMRRGSSLIGRPAFDSPPSLQDQKTGRSSGTNSATDQPGEETWARWITNEATRRAAFAAFVLDSIHATMFGHSAKMVAHEMRLPLPCDEGLWSATSAAEVARVQSSLQTNGIKPTIFLDGLKKTLNGQRVRTNSFGRTILMAGLLSVSWHMNQRDLSITSLGAGTFGPNSRDKWRSALLRAFDNWKRDFDEALVEATATTDAYPTPVSRSLVPRPIDDENIFESRTVLHHLAHMASHVDIVDCQIFGGASRILGRAITPKDYSNIREKIVERWATRASARDAAFYALKFLKQVLVPPDEGSAATLGHAMNPILPLAFEERRYLARDDFLLNRPWVLYFSALVVWSYGFALEGPIVPSPLLQGAFDKDEDMRLYLDRVGGVKKPDDLEEVEGRNRCLGLLLVLEESFRATRWELTREAAELLGNCAGMLTGEEGRGPVA